LEKIGVLSTVTSKTPPEDFSRVTSAPGNASRISAARLAARGSKFQTTQYSIDTHIADLLSGWMLGTHTSTGRSSATVCA